MYTTVSTHARANTAQSYGRRRSTANRSEGTHESRPSDQSGNDAKAIRARRARVGVGVAGPYIFPPDGTGADKAGGERIQRDAATDT